MLNAHNEYGKIVDLEQYSSDSRLTEPSDGKVYDYRGTGVVYSAGSSICLDWQQSIFKISGEWKINIV